MTANFSISSFRTPSQKAYFKPCAVPALLASKSSHTQSQISLLDAKFRRIFGMRMQLSLGHGVIEPILSTNRVAAQVTKPAVRAVDMDVSMCW